ncbi:MAG: hypothetical protein U0572_07810 [Phycisphaerales bacterium]
MSRRPNHVGRAKRIAAMAMAGLLLHEWASAAADEPRSSVSPVNLGIPLDNARFEIDGTTVLGGVFGGDLRLNAVTLGEATFTRDEGKLHEIAAVRVRVAQSDGSMRTLSDEELVGGAAAVRIIAGRDIATPPTTGLDTMGGLSVATMLINDGSADVQIDVLLPVGLKDDKPGKSDREPEAILVGAPPRGAMRLGAIIAGDIDDPLVAEGVVEVPPTAFEDGRSAASVLFGGLDKPRAIAMVGYDLDDLGVHEVPALGFRLEIPRGTIVACKIFGAGESVLDMLASAAPPEPFAGALDGGSVGGGGGGGGGWYSGQSTQGELALPSWGGGGGDISIDGGGGGGGGGSHSPPSPPEPPVPGPAGLAPILVGLCVQGSSRRRRS